MVDLNELNGFQKKLLFEALLAAFDSNSLARMLVFELDKNLEREVGGGDFRTQVFMLIQRSQQQGWTADLLQGARRAVPGNNKLAAVEQTFELTDDVAERGSAGRSLEKIVREEGGFVDVLNFVERLSVIQRRICRIELPVGSAIGTGFLIGPALVLTNYHVMRSAIDNPERARDVACRFYATGNDGTQSGREYTLAEDWLVDSAPPSRTDEKPELGLPRLDELDYCVIRLAADVGESDENKLEWFSADSTAEVRERGDILFVMQHPQGLPAEMAVGTVLGLNENNTRLRHDANTKPGSSGSPVFNANLNLVALHHSGDPVYDAPGKPKYNQAIPIGLVLERLKRD